jgi:hypothetical protein
MATLLVLPCTAGFTDYATLRSDPDLKPLGSQLSALVSKYDSPVAAVSKAVGGLLGKLQGKEELVSDPNKPRSWRDGMWW